MHAYIHACIHTYIHAHLWFHVRFSSSRLDVAVKAPPEFGLVVLELLCDLDGFARGTCLMSCSVVCWWVQNSKLSCLLGWIGSVSLESILSHGITQGRDRKTLRSSQAFMGHP